MCSETTAQQVVSGAATIRLRVKLFASLHVYLPEGSRRNEIDLAFPVTATPNAVLDQLKVPREMAHLVLRNGVYLKPSERDQPVLRDGDAFAVWPPVAGG